jgi:ABC-type transport system involved in Fe-S cluster assembly fused permease/ATPase subunit
VSQHRTLLIMAYRLSTVVDADQIAVLYRGRLAAIGRHVELAETSRFTANSPPTSSQ